MNKVQARVLKYMAAQASFKRHEEDFRKCKEDFYDFMDENMKGKVEDFSTSQQEISVTKIQTSSILFDIDKIKKKVGRKLTSKFLDKKYEIADYDGLVKYLKEFDVDPKVFKSFISVEEKVNEEKLNNLSELGKIEMEQLEGCYEVKTRKPFYTVRSKAREEDTN